MIDEVAIRARYAAIKDRLDERGRRLFVAAEKIAAEPPLSRGRQVSRTARSFAARKTWLWRRHRIGCGAQAVGGGR
jgi:hypothetical protein